MGQCGWRACPLSRSPQQGSASELRAAAWQEWTSRARLRGQPGSLRFFLTAYLSVVGFCHSALSSGGVPRAETTVFWNLKSDHCVYYKILNWDSSRLERSRMK